ncbi:hypothetical protein BSZ21_02695 [Bradyrhizobium canariense]|nr:hypothetical protein BSZ21_02695 [Bradyrhizobium canariense]
MVMTEAKAQLQALGRSAKRAHQRTKEGRTEFIAGTFELAAAFCRARSKLPSDQAFHAWIEQAGLRSIDKDDRCALILIGRHVTAARRFFMQNEDRWSWRGCASHLSMLAPVSQPAKPVVSPARTVTVHVTKEIVRLNAPYQVVTPEPKPLAAPLKLVTSKRECMTQPIAGETPRPIEAIGAVQALIEASSLSTETVALYWPFERGERPAPDRIREAAHWLELLADAVEAEALRKPQHH